MSVFAFGISSPDSMMVVQTNTSVSPFVNASIDFSSSPSDICPCAMPTRTSGTSVRMYSDIYSIL